ncbi:MAG: sugar phosphate isomerase/epimerase [Bacteroidota bacterium]
MPSNRREFIQQSSVLSASMMLPWQGKRKALPVACQQYTWTTFFRREGRSWEEDYRQSLSDFKASGLQGIESFLPDLPKSQALIEEFGLWQRSAYVNAWLHEEEKVEETVQTIVADAAKAKPGGVEIIVVNPTPIDWNKAIDKSDHQLGIQREGLTELARQLKAQGQVLAYHNHDAEFRVGAREFHHMLGATDPGLVKLCLDPHWIYRGAGNSQVALWDAVNLYGDRIVELHLRQSVDGIWSETFGEGDIQYDTLLDYLLKHDLKPHLVLEQAVETGSPHKMNPIEAHRQSLRNTRSQFASLQN